jgi:hypothetical protein
MLLMTDHTFIYQGINFSIPYPPTEARKGAEDETTRLFETYDSSLRLRDAVQKNGAVIWEKLVIVKEIAPDLNAAEEMIKILVAVGIMSYSRTGNWDILTADGGSCNPRDLRGNRLYFVRENDVSYYALVAYDDSLFDWSLVQYGKVIPKSVVMN